MLLSKVPRMPFFIGIGSISNFFIHKCAHHYLQVCRWARLAEHHVGQSGWPPCSQQPYMDTHALGGPALSLPGYLFYQDQIYKKWSKSKNNLTMSTRAFVSNWGTDIKKNTTSLHLMCPEWISRSRNRELKYLTRKIPISDWFF